MSAPDTGQVPGLGQPSISRHGWSACSVSLVHLVRRPRLYLGPPVHRRLDGKNPLMEGEAIDSRRVCTLQLLPRLPHVHLPVHYATIPALHPGPRGCPNVDAFRRSRLDVGARNPPSATATMQCSCPSTRWRVEQFVWRPLAHPLAVPDLVVLEGRERLWFIAMQHH